MTRKFLIWVAVGVAVVAVLVLRPAPRPSATVVSASVSHGKPKLLDLGATSCAPCKAMVPVLEELRASYREQLDVEFINVWENPAAGETWHVAVMPTQVFVSPKVVNWPATRASCLAATSSPSGEPSAFPSSES